MVGESVGERQSVLKLKLLPSSVPGPAGPAHPRATRGTRETRGKTGGRKDGGRFPRIAYRERGSTGRDRKRMNKDWFNTNS